ncbi:hypothetical protein MSPP1_002027 [Malassezia sp. CBS 17886]|nr:hypothetical protein MSPP1_002027 [Malassezia sp. CBS 17886]
MASQQSVPAPPGDAASLGLMDSISPECTPLKHRYDQCFNSWFRDYLDVATQEHNPSSSSWGRSAGSMFSAGSSQSGPLAKLRDQYEANCGKLFSEYQACVKLAVHEKGLDDAIVRARNENPFPEQHQR